MCVWIILATVGMHIIGEHRPGWMRACVRACISMATNTSSLLFDLQVTRMSVWLTFCINTLTLILCYLLSQLATDVTFHNETNCWLKENVHIVVASLIALGLASCALFELCAKFKLYWLSGGETLLMQIERGRREIQGKQALIHNHREETKLTELNYSPSKYQKNYLNS